jgi:ParB family chromosome partitioning protein
MNAPQQSRLGRGLGALLNARAIVDAQPDPSRSALRQIAIGQIRPNPFQPRKDFRPDDLADLESSMRTNGLLQPISVRPAPGGAGFELIAGERRLRAAQRLGWTDVPAIVKTIDDRSLLSLALVENLQRTDLNPIEEAEGYQRLIAEFELTQQDVADAVGKDRSTIANILRLLALPASVRRLVWEGAISIGHARALLSLGDEAAIASMAKQIVADGLSVREVERRARDRAQAARAKSRDRGKTSPVSAEVRRIEDQLRRRLQTDVNLVVGPTGKGELRVTFYSPDDLERVLDLIVGADRSW